MLKLFPEYKYVFVGKDGMVSLSKSLLHLIFIIFDRVHLTELCLVQIPERLEMLRIKVFKENDTPVYENVYNSYSHIVLEMLHHRSRSIIDYLHDQYWYIKYGINKNYNTVHNILPEYAKSVSTILSRKVKTDSIVLSRLSNAHVKQSLLHWKRSLFVFDHPKLLSNTLSMWLRNEVREHLRQHEPHYHVEINAA